MKEESVKLFNCTCAAVLPKGAGCIALDMAGGYIAAENGKELEGRLREAGRQEFPDLPESNFVVEVHLVDREEMRTLKGLLANSFAFDFEEEDKDDGALDAEILTNDE